MRTFQCHAYASCPVNSSIRHCARRTRLSNQSRIPYDQQQQQHRQQQQQQQQAATVSTAVTSSDAEPPRDHAAQREVPEGIAEPMSEEAVASEKQRHKKLWFAAVKPPMYTVSIVPILVGIECFASVCGTENGCCRNTSSKYASECRFLLQLHMLLLGHCRSTSVYS